MPVIRIRGQSFELYRRWGQGHQLTAGEAQALTQLFCENVRNNTDQWPDGPDLPERIAEYARNYQFLVRERAIPVTGLERHLREVGEEQARIALGLGPDEPPPEAMVLEQMALPEASSEAKRRVEASRVAVQMELESLL